MADSTSEDAQALRRQGYRMTPQRLMVLDVIRVQAGHMTAEEIHALIVERQPGVDIATVYRTLQWLETVALVAPLRGCDGTQRYEYQAPGQRHHHLLCQQCGGEIEVPDDVLDSLKAELLARYGFYVQVTHLALPGRCAACGDSER